MANKKKNKKNKANNGNEQSPKTWVQNTLPLIYLIVALFALRWTVVEPYHVPTGSMEPTLKKGDRLYALKCAYDIRFPFTNWILFRTGTVERGDVILFIAPPNPSLTYVKRALGLPGDRIQFVGGEVFVNGEKVPRQPAPDRKLLYDVDPQGERDMYIENLEGVPHYVLHMKTPSWANDNIHKGRNSPELVVPEGHLFAVGDNRDQSYDSRFWGFVPIDNLKGRAIFIWYSSRPVFTGMGWLADLIAGWFDPRSERVGTLIQ